VPLDIRQIPKIDLVIFSHDHYDHLNKFSEQRLIEKSDKFIVPVAVGAQLIDWGVPPGETTVYSSSIRSTRWWEQAQSSFNATQ
jgi:L-ascorbate metabolism protein UlaG (beta-lactamase superfamily)